MGEKIENGTYVREYYQVPAHKGRLVLWRGRDARIVGFDGAYLRLKLLDVSPLDDETDGVVAHPTWEVEYPQVAEAQDATGEGEPAPLHAVVQPDGIDEDEHQGSATQKRVA